MNKLVIVSSVFFLFACSSPPKPSVVDGSDKHAINSHTLAAALALRAELAQTKEKQNSVSLSAIEPTPPLAASQTISVYFPFNGTKFNPTVDQARALLPLLKNARRVIVRGRTDGQRPSPPDEQVALNRALSAKQFLVTLGVSPAVISVNYLSAGDYLADNDLSVGRSKNRRVDIEIVH